MKNYRFLLLIVLTILLTGLFGGSLFAQDSAQKKETSEIESKFLESKDAIPDKYIVVFKEDNAAVESIGDADAMRGFAQSVAAQYGGQVDRVYSNALKGFSVEMTEKQARALSEDPLVKYVVEDGMAYPSATQYNPVWGLDRIDQQFRPYSGSYNYTATGAGVRAYVIDSGILPWHGEFGGRAFIGADFVGGNGVDCNGHGTHVAGTIAGANVGVAKAATVIGVRVFTCSGGSAWSTIIAGIDWVRANRVLPAVANMSLGGGANQAIDDATRNLINSGVTVVVAAGNSGMDANGFSPARVREAITVGATDVNDHRVVVPGVWASNYGTALDLFAPGLDITSAWFDGGYRSIGGTSMATPHVAGAAATYLNVNPGASPATVQNVLVSYSTWGVLANIGPGSPNRLLFSGLYNSCGVLYSGQFITRGQSITACNGAVTLVFQTDGNVVLYKNTGPNAGRALWHTGTYNRPDADVFFMQTDGNLVLYARGAAIWHTSSWNNPGAFLMVQNDSNLVLYRTNGTPIWHTGTHGQ